MINLEDKLPNSHLLTVFKGVFRFSIVSVDCRGPFPGILKFREVPLTALVFTDL